MNKLYWNIIVLKSYKLFLVLDEKGMCFLDFMNNPKLMNNFIKWMINLKINALLEHNPEQIIQYLQKNKLNFL